MCVRSGAPSWKPSRLALVPGHRKARGAGLAFETPATAFDALAWANQAAAGWPGLQPPASLPSGQRDGGQIRWASHRNLQGSRFRQLVTGGCRASSPNSLEAPGLSVSPSPIRPTGERIGEQDNQLPSTCAWRRLRAALGWVELPFFTTDTACPGHRLDATPQDALFSSALECRLYEMETVAGSKPQAERRR